MGGNPQQKRQNVCIERKVARMQNAGNAGSGKDLPVV